MPSSHFFTKFIMSSKMLGESKILVQTNITLTSLRYWGLIGLDGAMSSGEQCPDMLRRWRRWKWSFEDSQGRWTNTWIGIGICRWVLEETWERTWAVKWKVWGFSCLGIRWRKVWVLNCGDLGLRLVGFDGFSMTESHGIKNPERKLPKKNRNFQGIGNEDHRIVKLRTWDGKQKNKV